MTLIYLACPYSHPNPAVVQARYHYVNKVAGVLMGRGQVVFSPITHSHVIAEEWALPRSWEFWREQDIEILKRCDLLVVLKIPGWEQSVGVTEEINAAIMNGMRVLHLDPEKDLPAPLNTSYPIPYEAKRANSTVN